MFKQKNNPVKHVDELTPLCLKRQLSVTYIAPDGRLTADDPASYKGQECIDYQNALIAQQPRTGYAEGILERRAAGFFSPKKREAPIESTSAPSPQ